MELEKDVSSVPIVDHPKSANLDLSGLGFSESLALLFEQRRAQLRQSITDMISSDYAKKVEEQLTEINTVLRGLRIHPENSGH